MQRKLYAEAIEPNLDDGDALFFGHGFNIRFGYIKPPAGVDVVHGRAEGPRPPGAPPVRRRPGRAGARRGRAGRDRQRLGARAVLRQGASAAPAPARIKTTFTEETETDLFGEQAVLCGGASQLVQAGFETLTEAGYQPRDRLLRVPARAQADRRPDVRGRHRQACAGRSPTPPSTATTSAARASSTTPSRRRCSKILGEIQIGRSPRVDRRGRRRPPELHASSASRASAPDRGDRREAAPDDVLGEVRGRLHRAPPPAVPRLTPVV